LRLQFTAAWALEIGCFISEDDSGNLDLQHGPETLDTVDACVKYCVGKGGLRYAGISDG